VYADTKLRDQEDVWMNARGCAHGLITNMEKVLLVSGQLCSTEAGDCHKVLINSARGMLLRQLCIG
jgi:hypothetical protein